MTGVRRGPDQPPTPMRSLDGRLKVVKMNVHQNMKTAMNYKILAMPTFVVLKGGREVARQRGAQGGLEGLRRLVGSHVR